MSQDEIDASKAPLIEHLIELRQRLMWSIGAILPVNTDAMKELTRAICDVAA